MLLDEIERERQLGHVLPGALEIGAMLETPSLAFAPQAFFEMTDFISIGGNDLKQFFFAADRENERVRRRYDTLNMSFLRFIEHDRRALRGDRHATVLLRRGCRPPGRGAVPRRHGHRDAVDAPGLDRAGQAPDPARRSGELRQVIDTDRDAGALNVAGRRDGLARPAGYLRRR